MMDIVFHREGNEGSGKVLMTLKGSFRSSFFFGNVCRCEEACSSRRV